MKGLSRKFWYKNQLLYTQLDRLLSLTDRQNISLFAIRGTAINLAYYPDLVLRPVEEIDLSLNYEKIDYFKELLLSNNWQEISPTYVNNILRFLHRKTSVKLDIYQYLLQNNLESENHYQDLELEKKLISNLKTIKFKNHKIKILTPEDQLLQVLIQGQNPQFVSPYRWIMDAIQIITSTSQFDWLYFQKIQQQVKQENSISSMLEYLKNTFKINIL